MLNLSELVENSKVYLGESAFFITEISTNGVPIDLLRIHLLGHVLNDYTILVADELYTKKIAGCSELKDLNLKNALDEYKRALSLFQKVWPNKNKIIAFSDLINEKDYKEVAKSIRKKLKELNLWDKLKSAQNEIVEKDSFRRNFSFHKLAVIDFLRKKNAINVKIGISNEKKYDNFIKKIIEEIKFLYLHKTHALTGFEEPLPYAVNNLTSITNKRILISDDLDTVEEKLNLGSRKALEYFAILGSLAGKARGSNWCLSSEKIKNLTNKKLTCLAKDYVLNNILIPIRRTAGISVYEKSNMRKIYDQTVEKLKVKLKNRIPELELARSELDSITTQLLYLTSKRIKQGFLPEIYNKNYPNLNKEGILLQVPEELFKPFFEILLERKERSFDENLDLKIMRLLQERVLIGYDVALAKLQMNKPVYDSEREMKVIDELVIAGRKYKLNPNSLKLAFQFLMSKSRELQEIVISRYEIDFKNKN